MSIAEVARYHHSDTPCCGSRREHCHKPALFTCSAVQTTGTSTRKQEMRKGSRSVSPTARDPRDGQVQRYGLADRHRPHWWKSARRPLPRRPGILAHVDLSFDRPEHGGVVEGRQAAGVDVVVEPVGQPVSASLERSIHRDDDAVHGRSSPPRSHGRRHAAGSAGSGPWRRPVAPPRCRRRCP